MKLTETPAWKALAAHARAMEGIHLRELFARDPGRFERFSLKLPGLLFDYSKHRITQETLEHLLALAEEAQLSAWIGRLFNGEPVNFTERRPALHIALRNVSNRPILVDGKDVMPEVNRVLDRMGAFAEAVRSGAFKGYTGRPMEAIVNIGIGGSDLGPAMATAALAPYHHPRLKAHFVSNIDGAHIHETLKGLDPATTLFIVVSKTFATQETLENAKTARAWFLEKAPEEAVASHFVAVSTHTERVRAFGIDPKNMFEFWDWVGGRYSLWSAVGLAIAIMIGMDRFKEMLAGGHRVDEHFRTAPLKENIPALMGLLAVWYNDFLGAESHAVLPYSQLLARFPAYLQQLEMESLGKRTDREGKVVDYDTGQVLWGEPGTNGQHAFFQLLHQGTRLVPCDFIAFLRPHHPYLHHHRILLANCFAQSEALMRGRTEEEARAELKGLPQEELEALLPHRVFPGNRPSSTFLCDELSPQSLGMLIALYEHKVFVQSVIWRINAFDQWGVELGKQLARAILPELEGEVADHDASTRGLILYYQKHMHGI
ncbi:MAG: glucose-6-phosphate isomerase [Gammaproteobacteria bacterium]|nr:MAG: glucose-6-phosphate isomerase [Gammaproteobacteria bacterium]